MTTPAAVAAGAGRGASMQRQELALLVNQIAQSITGTLELDRVFELTVEKTRQFLGARSASLLLLDEKTDELYFDTVSGRPGEETLRIRIAPGEGVAGWVAQNAEPVLVSDVERDPRFSWRADVTSGDSGRSLVAAPLIAAGRVLGVLEAASAPEGPAFDEAALEALCWLAPHVAVAVKNSRDTAELIRSRLDLARSNRALERRVQERTAQIARAKREWELTFDSIQDPICLLEGTTVRRANLAFARLVGLPITAVIGRTCHELLGGQSESCAACQASGGTGRGEAVIAGRTFEVASFAFPEGREGDVEQVVGFRDVTDARALEQKLRESERLASVGQLASGAAHEINNPLGFLKSNLGTLQTYFEDLQRAVDRLELVEDRVRRGELTAVQALAGEGLVPSEARVALEDVPVALAESLEGVRRVGSIVQALKALTRDASRATARERLDTLLERAALRAELPPAQLDVDPCASRELEVEPHQLELALANVLRNARQASPRDRVIRVRTGEEGGFVTITVVDEGCGMEPEVRARIFDPFFTTRETGSGVGLGLTAAWGIVKRHGGHIDVQSQPGEGTTVRIALPPAPPRG